MYHQLPVVVVVVVLDTTVVVGVGAGVNAGVDVASSKGQKHITITNYLSALLSIFNNYASNIKRYFKKIVNQRER